MIEYKLVDLSGHILVTKSKRIQLFQKVCSLIISLILYPKKFLKKTVHKITHFEFYKIILNFFKMEELRYIY